MNFNLARSRAIADYQQNLARLEQLVGGKIGDFRMSLKESTFFSLITLAILLSGCASQRQETYQALLDAEIPQSDYYQAEVEKQEMKLGINASAESDPFLSEVEAKVLKYQKQWQAQLDSEESGSTLFYDFSSPAVQAYRDLAASPEAAKARLIEPIELELLLALGYAWNPGLKASYQKVRATLEQYPQAVYLDNVLRQYNAFTKQLDTKVGPLRHKEMMMMKFRSQIR